MLHMYICYHLYHNTLNSQQLINQLL